MPKRTIPTLQQSCELTDLYKDNYCHFFSGCGNFASFLDTQKEIDSRTSWEKIASGFAIIPVIDDNLTDIPSHIITDTRQNMGVMMLYNTPDGSIREACIRTSAMPSLLATARCNGTAITEASNEDFATILTLCAKSCREQSNLMLRAGKISAVFSTRYQYMPISRLLDVICNLEAKYGIPEFHNGTISHSMTACHLDFPEASGQFTEAYNKYLTRASKSPHSKLTPVLSFRSSDTSCSAARLDVYLRRSDGAMLPMCNIAVNHTGSEGVCMERFERECFSLFNKAETAIDSIIPKMLDTPIHYPANTFISLCKFAHIPQKFGGIVEEELRGLWEDGDDCTFLDIFELLSKVTAVAVRTGSEPLSRSMMNMEDGIAKIARNRAYWTKFDNPGTVAWGLEDNHD